MLKCFKLADGVQFHQCCWLRSKQVACRFAGSMLQCMLNEGFGRSLGMSCPGELGRSIELNLFALMGESQVC